jgi:hypothetical protein
MSSTTEVTTRAAELRDAAQALHDAVDAVDARHVDLRMALGDVGRALGELARTSAAICRDLDTAGPGASPSSELIRRNHELTASLLNAQRNVELVCRHLPRRPDRGVAVAAGRNG